MNILFGLLSLLTFFCFSQSDAQVRFAARGGLNVAYARFDGQYTGIDTRPVVRPYLGVAAAVPLASQFYLRPELLISLKGWQERHNRYDTKTAYTVTYLSLPVLLGYNTGKFSFFAGPELSMKLGARPIDYFETTDFGLAAGGTYSLHEKVLLELKYTHGFSALVEVEMRDQFNNPMGEWKDGHNRVLQVGVLYYLK